MALKRRMHSLLPYKTEFVIIRRYWNDDWIIVTKLELLSPVYKNWDVVQDSFLSHKEAQDCLVYSHMDD